MAISEFGFSVDDFESPKVYKSAEGVCTLLVRLLLLNPGTFQSHPDMGIGLVSYKYSVEGIASTLQTEIERQIEKYLPLLQGAKITVTEKNHTLYIAAQVDNTLYGISFDQNTTKVAYNYTNLSEL